MLDQSDYFLYINWFLFFIELNELPGGFVTVGTRLNPLRVRRVGLVDSGTLETLDSGTLETLGLFHHYCLWVVFHR